MKTSITRGQHRWEWIDGMLYHIQGECMTPIPLPVDVLMDLAAQVQPQPQHITVTWEAPAGASEGGSMPIGILTYEKPSAAFQRAADALHRAGYGVIDQTGRSMRVKGSTGQ